MLKADCSPQSPDVGVFIFQVGEAIVENSSDII